MSPCSRLLLLCSLIPSLSFAQSFFVSGSIRDQQDQSALPGVTVVLMPFRDTNQKIGTVTDVDGQFQFAQVPRGGYLLRASFIGYEPFTQRMRVQDSMQLGNLLLQRSSTTLQSVQVTAQQIAAQQSGDTTSFNAGAYKTNPDATAEDLINKMPGISSQGGSVKAQGEDVKQVLVDGKPFFGDDPNAALKNLPSEIIDRIQVFDRMSDQANFTGFDDGQGQKTINIITRPGRNNGQFGKLYGGIGLTEFSTKGNGLYQGGGNVNFFKGSRRISIIALSNNINQQNFSTDDLMGVINSSSGQTRGGSGAGFGGGRGMGGFSGGGGRGMMGGGSDPSSFLVGQQAGITTTHSVGINYSDNWGKKVRVTGSYFFNYTSNDNNTSLNRTYFTNADSNLIYKEESFTNTKNINHRANLRLEYTIDSFNSIILTPRISFQDNTYNKDLTGRNRLPDSSLAGLTVNKNASNNFGYNFSNNLLFQHRFDKRGRTASFSINTTANNRVGDGSLYALNEYTDVDTTLLDQRYNQNNGGYTVSGNVTYTEPITKSSQLMISYNPSYTSNHADKETKSINGIGQYTDLDTLLTNKFDNTYTTQRGGISYRVNTEKMFGSISLNAQEAVLSGEQQFPRVFSLEKRFTNVLPSAMLNYRFTRTKNLRFFYRTNTNAPSISQLQNVVDNSNPLLLRTGNPDLKQDYSHTLTLRYGATNVGKGTNFFAAVFGTYTQNYIGNATFIPTGRPLFIDSIVINPGAQLTRPVNLDGNYSIRSFANYGLPLKPIKSNLNLNAGASLNRIPARINRAVNYANNYALTGGFVLSSNISENLDFTLSYTGNYNVVRNTIQKQSDNNYFNHTTTARFNWIFLKGFVLNSSLNHNLYTGLAQGFNQSFLLWNAGLGYKFFKDRSLDVRVTVNDILNQNRAIQRTVTETYIEDSYTTVLRRFFMLQLTYTLRRFGNAPAAPRNPEGMGFPPPGGMGPGSMPGGMPGGGPPFGPQ